MWGSPIACHRAVSSPTRPPHRVARLDRGGRLKGGLLERELDLDREFEIVELEQRRAITPTMQGSGGSGGGSGGSGSGGSGGGSGT